MTFDPASFGKEIHGRIGETVYQDTDPRFANSPTPSQPRRMVRSHTIPRDPRTPGQLAQREKMRLLPQMWRALTEAERNAYRQAAKTAAYNAITKRRTKWANGYQFFISQFLNLDAGNITEKELLKRIRGRAWKYQQEQQQR